MTSAKKKVCKEGNATPIDECSRDREVSVDTEVTGDGVAYDGRALSFGAKLRRRRREVGMTLEEVAGRIGCRKGYLSMIETGRRPPPGENIMVQLESVLGYSRGELAEVAYWESASPIVRERVLRRVNGGGGGGQKMELNGLKLPGFARDLDEMLKNGLLRQLAEKRAGNVDGPLPLTTRIPIVNKVAAGYPTHFTDLDYPARFADDYAFLPGELGDEDAFAARVVGDSMEPMYHEGDVVVFSPASGTPSGSDCFVRLEPEHDTTFKRIYFEGEDGGRIRLHPLNSEYPERVVAREEVAGMYAAVFVLRRVGGV